MTTTIKLVSMQPKLRLFMITLSVILFSLVTTSVFGQATVSTDKEDYPPGATVMITGSGFQPGEAITLQVIHVGDGDNSASGVHAPWDVLADSSGNVTSTWIVPIDQDELGATLKLTADGKISLLHAEAIFTDSSPQIVQIGFNTVNQPASFTVGIPNGTSVPLRVQARNSGGTGENVTGSGNSVTVVITANSPTGRFDISNTGSFANNSITLQIIASSQNTPDFFYRDITAGNIVLTATVTATNGVSNLPLNSTATLNKTVNKANSTTTLISNINPSAFGQSVTLTATVVHSIAGAAGMPTGNVTFKDGATTLGSGTLSSGQATFSTSGLSVGNHTISAVYTGDNNFNSSTSSNLTQTVSKANQTITFNNPGTKTYGDADFDLGATASSGLTVSYSVTNGPATIVSGNMLHITGAGSITVKASQNGNTSYNAAPDVSQTFQVNKANATIEVTPYNVIYDGNAHTAIYTAKGVKGEDLTGVSVNTTHTDAGDYTSDSWSFTDVTGNYNDVSTTTITDHIGKASTTTVVTIAGGPFTYTGSAITPATVSVTGVNLSLTPIADYLNNINAGTATASYSYAGDDNHLGSSDSKTFDIGKKQLTVTADNKSKTYDGQTFTVGGGIFSSIITGFAGSETLVTSGVTGSATYIGPATTAVNYGNYVISPTIGTLSANNYSFAFANGILQINKRSLDITGSKVYNANTTFNAASLTPGNLIGSDVVNLGGSATVSNKNAGHYSSFVTNSLTSSNTNYQVTGGTISVDITQRTLNVTATGIDKVYDGNTTATVNLSSDKIVGDDVSLFYSSAFFADPNVGTWNVSVNGIYISGADATNYNLANSTYVTSAKISKANTATVLVTSASVVRFMDQFTMTAIIKPGNTGSLLTGTVQFKIGSILYGSPVAVVPIQGDPDGKVQATYIGQVSNLPTASYPVEASFTSTNLNYGNSLNTKSLQVNQRNADPYDPNQGFYTGDLFAWTTGQNSNTATIKLSTTIKDNNNPAGDLRAAKVTFYLVNGTSITPITGATNLPVGLVDVNDGSVGTASAIVQFNIGSNNAQDFKVAVGISGAYYNMQSSSAAQAIVTVSKPVPGGYMVCGGRTQNVNSSGYIKGNPGMNTDFESDIVYTKSGTNPKGKADVLIRSYYKTDGTLDTRLHTYIINTNAIASLNVAGSSPAVATFSSKANLLEQMPDMSLVSIEGGSVFEMIVTQQGCTQQAAITLYRKAGGIWFTNNWNGTKTVPQLLNGGQASVAGGGTCSLSSYTVVKDRKPEATQVLLTYDMRAYPNPTTSQFNIKLESSNKTDAISIIVYSVNGKVVEQRQNLNANQTIQLGALYRPGVYILEIIQGNERKQLKLVKIPD